MNKAILKNKSDEQVKTIHTEVTLSDRAIGFDLICTESHLLQLRGNNFIYEPDVMAAIINIVKPGDVCIDAGANLGYHSILMSKMTGKSGQVLAFEPDPTCIDKLRNNLILNDVADICFPAPVALWEGNIKEANFYVMKECGYGSFVKFHNVEQTSVGVETVALDSVINPESHIRFLKIDCEGAEEGILHGAEGLLKRGVDAVVVEFNFSISRNDRKIRNFMNALGYDLFFLFDNGQFPELILPDTIIQRGEHRFHFNGLFSKNLNKDNWKTAASFASLVPTEVIIN